MPNAVSPNVVLSLCYRLSAGEAARKAGAGGVLTKDHIVYKYNKQAVVRTVCLDHRVHTVAKDAFRDCDALETVTWRRGCVGSSSVASSTLLCALFDAVERYEPGVSDLIVMFVGHLCDGVRIEDSAFSNCNRLRQVTFPEDLAAIGAFAFLKCVRLREVTLPERLSTIGSYAFWECSQLTEVIFCEGLITIGEAAFGGCSQLRQVTFPAGLSSIGYGAFYGCLQLSAVTFPDGLTLIGDGAFGGCSQLRQVAFPEGLTTIGSYAFNDCVNLRDVIFPKEPQGPITIGKGAFNGCCLSFPSINNLAQIYRRCNGRILREQTITIM